MSTPIDSITLRWSDVPSVSYVMCPQSSCPLASKCFRAIAFTLVPTNLYLVQVANPARCTKDENCPYLRPAVADRFAKGFTSWQAQMLPGQYSQLREHLKSHFGRMGYINRRNGKTAITPEEQEYIWQELAKVGVNVKLEFDDYQDRLAW